MSACIFCKIGAGEIASSRVFEDERCFVIRDIQPQAKTHLLVIPKQHLSSLLQADALLSGHLLQVATQVAHQEGIAESGFRTVINTGAQGGQTVFHLHVHLLGGEPLNGRFA